MGHSRALRRRRRGPEAEWPHGNIAHHHQNIDPGGPPVEHALGGYLGRKARLGDDQAVGVDEVGARKDFGQTGRRIDFMCRRH
jgi:hypothetical protein